MGRFARFQSERAVKPPFRADQVGSLLRPEALKAAREKYLGPQTPTNAIGPHSNSSLKNIEDECVREVIAMQERVGLKAVTDGEFRRRSWWLELILGWEGFAADRTGSGALKWRNEGGVTQGFSDLKLTGRIRWQPSSVVRAFEFLSRNTKRIPKVTMPAPNCVHYYMGGQIPASVYPDRDAFWADLVKAYKQEIRALVDAGARYIQLDDTSIAFICDPAHREYVRSWGEDPEKLLFLYAQKINEVLADVPDDVSVTLHQCRGNREGNWAAEGGYDPVAEVLFNRIDVDGYFLEYDTARAGGFEPLRLAPKGKRVVLGLVSSKKPAVESEKELVGKIETASRYLSLDQLALSPQCGFASSIKGNPLGPAEQEAKLRRIVEVADKVWGSA
jgi:5-methyltetrahydropteroyltriglutamate--homocysteine methyltransferase